MDVLTPGGRILIYLRRQRFVGTPSFRGGLSHMICHIANMLKTNLRQIFIKKKNSVVT